VAFPPTAPRQTPTTPKRNEKKNQNGKLKTRKKRFSHKIVIAFVWPPGYFVFFVAMLYMLGKGVK